MVSVKAAKEIAVSFDEVTESPHFDRIAFKVKGKIFAALSEEKKLMMAKLTELDQSVFCSFNKDIIYPVPGGWGQQGATYIELAKVPKNMLKDVLAVAYCSAAPKKLADKYRVE